ncbi:MAG: hypothetical protein RI953_842 [Pseudomonadota bacterium]
MCLKLPGGIPAATVVVASIVALAGAAFSHVLNSIVIAHQKFSLLVFCLPVVLWLTLELGNRVERLSVFLSRKLRLSSLADSGSTSDLLMMPLCWLSHLAGASVGRESVAVQMGRGISRIVGECFGLTQESSSRELLIRVGMASGFAAVFGTPWTALVFAFEWRPEQREDELGRKSMFTECGAQALGWAALASALSWFIVHRIFHVSHAQFVFKPQEFNLQWFAFLIVILSFATGLGWAHNKSKIVFTNMLDVCRRKMFLRVLLPSFLLLLFFLNDSNEIYRGLGLNLVDKAFSDTSSNGLDVWDPLIKSLLTTFCLSSGFKGGEVTPLLAIGASSGYALADVLGVQTQAAAAVGYPLLFAVIFSVPLSCIALSFEVFGFENGVSGAVLCLFLLLKNYFRQS